MIKQTFRKFLGRTSKPPKPQDQATPFHDPTIATQPQNMAKTIATKFLILSDTHDFTFGDAEKCNGSLTLPTPKTDVILHCGDITKGGGVSAYEDFLAMMSSIDAELKLVIAGNHDRDLDEQHIIGLYHEGVGQNAHDRAYAMMTGPLAKAAGVIYLEEGLRSFTLKSGAKFTIYTSPYQPEFCHWAFPYERDEDRFNPPEHVAPGVKSIVKNPIPDFPGVDIIMTHGPPQGILDLTSRGQTAGCQALLKAARRAKPRLYCFGHIHEAYGAEVITWKDGDSGDRMAGIEKQTDVENVYPAPNKVDLKVGKESLLVNAAIMNLRYRPVHSPWLVELDLPVGRA